MGAGAQRARDHALRDHKDPIATVMPQAAIEKRQAEDERVCGIVTRTDFFTALAERFVSG
jgi:hypothetical protein